METLSALYANASQAVSAVDGLKEAGISSKNISLVSTNVGDELSEMSESIPADDTLKGILSGGIWGGALGFLVGLTALAIPGIGPIVAAGPIAAAIGGAEIGAVAGGLVGALTDLGLDEDNAKRYASQVKAGETLVVARVDDGMSGAVRKILNSHNPSDKA